MIAWRIGKAGDDTGGVSGASAGNGSRNAACEHVVYLCEMRASVVQEAGGGR